MINFKGSGLFCETGLLVKPLGLAFDKRFVAGGRLIYPLAISRA